MLAQQINNILPPQGSIGLGNYKLLKCIIYHCLYSRIILCFKQKGYQTLCPWNAFLLLRHQKTIAHIVDGIALLQQYAPGCLQHGHQQ